MMKKTGLLLLLLSPSLFSLAQSKTYFSLHFGKDFPVNRHVIGGYVTANRDVAKDVYLGAGFAITHFDHIRGMYYPLFANLSIMPGKEEKKLFPVFFLQPGYGFYAPRGTSTTQGGFLVHTHAGIGYPFLWKTKGYTTIGWGHYGFRTDGKPDHKTGYGFRVGMMF